MRKSAILILLLLAGCSPPMTNDQVIAETRKCNDAGLRAVPVQDIAYYTRRIHCLPKLEPRP